jgi:uncharacterized protein with ParB-like and HNH nuclease domain
MNTSLSFEAKDKRLEEILFGTYKFKIPRFQRPYSWTEDNVSEFWNDLISSKSSFFIGSFILNQESLEEYKYIEVIDGQQRLLTITIFISVLRDIAKELGASDVAERLQRQCIAFEDRRGEQSFRIECGDSTKAFFEKYIQSGKESISLSEPSTKEEQRIKSNHFDFHAKVTDELKKYSNKEDKLNYLQTLREKISDLLVIDIKIDNEEDAYEIFETVNARGVELSVGDLLKNLIFKKIKADGGRDIAKEMWSEIEENIEGTKTELKKFIRYYWISKYSFVTEKKLFREIKKEITDWSKFIEDCMMHQIGIIVFWM